MVDRRLDKWVNSFLKGCVTKKAYKSLGLAEEVAKRVLKERGITLHCYWCKECGCYHLTRKKSKGNVF